MVHHRPGGRVFRNQASIGVKNHARRTAEHDAGAEYTIDLLPKIKLELALPDEQIDKAVDAIQKAAKTGQIGDGKVFVYELNETVRIRTGETGPDAI